MLVSPVMALFCVEISLYDEFTSDVGPTSAQRIAKAIGTGALNTTDRYQTLYVIKYQHQDGESNCW